MSFRNLSSSQLRVFEQIAISNDSWHSPTVLRSLEKLGLIVQHKSGYEVPVAVHIEWCEWCDQAVRDLP